MNEFDLNAFYEKLDKIFYTQGPDEIVGFLQDNLAIVKKQGDVNGEIAVCNELGSFFRASGRTAEAQKLLERSLELLAAHGGEETVEYATALINYGDTFVVGGDMVKAVEVFERAGEILKKNGYENDYRMAAVYNNSSAAYKNLGNFSKAEKALEGAFAIIARIPGTEQQVAVTGTNLGELRLAQGNLDGAEEAFSSALAMFEKIAPDEEYGSSDVHYSAALAGCARLKWVQGFKEEAERLEQRAEAVRMRDYGV